MPEVLLFAALFALIPPAAWYVARRAPRSERRMVAVAMALAPTLLLVILVVATRDREHANGSGGRIDAIGIVRPWPTPPQTSGLDDGLPAGDGPGELTTNNPGAPEPTTGLVAIAPPAPSTPGRRQPTAQPELAPPPALPLPPLETVEPLPTDPVVTEDPLPTLDPLPTIDPLPTEPEPEPDPEPTVDPLPTQE
ncbi:MAG: hypothetical protein IRZ08_02580, partial [Frankia sp.]|nr:hypothetical protein [Frankia sp.]